MNCFVTSPGSSGFVANATNWDSSRPGCEGGFRSVPGVGPTVQGPVLPPRHLRSAYKESWTDLTGGGGVFLDKNAPAFTRAAERGDVRLHQRHLWEPSWAPSLAHSLTHSPVPSSSGGSRQDGSSWYDNYLRYKLLKGTLRRPSYVAPSHVADDRIALLAKALVAATRKASAPKRTTRKPSKPLATKKSMASKSKASAKSKPSRPSRATSRTRTRR